LYLFHWSAPQNGVDGALYNSQRMARLDELLPGRIIELDSLLQPVCLGSLLHPARHENLAIGRGFFRSFYISDEARDLGGKCFLSLKDGGIHHDREHIV